MLNWKILKTGAMPTNCKQIRKKSISIYVSPKLNINEEKLKILYNNCTLACCDSSKYLGVVIDNKLNF